MNGLQQSQIFQRKEKLEHLVSMGFAGAVALQALVGRERFRSCTIFQGSGTFLRWTPKDVPLRNTSNACCSNIQPNWTPTTIWRNRGLDAQQQESKLKCILTTKRADRMHIIYLSAVLHGRRMVQHRFRSDCFESCC